MDQQWYEGVGRRQEWEETMAGLGSVARDTTGSASGYKAAETHGTSRDQPLHSKIPAALMRYLTRLGISQPGKGEEEALRLGLLPEHLSRLLKVYRRLNRGR